MYLYWEILVRPALEAIRAKCLIEVGSAGGDNTRNLLAHCEANDAILHAVDPAPSFDVAAAQRRYGSRFIMHRDLSLNVLDKLPPADVVFLDGDHNWYTVINELRTLDRQYAAADRPFPLTFLHDVGWPYGRRDMYYNPATIPLAEQQPHAKQGIRPGESTPVRFGGFNNNYMNATTENTPRNGVLTAVEDFLNETARPLGHRVIHGFYGMAFLYPTDLPQRLPAFADFLKVWTLAPPVVALLHSLETCRLVAEVQHTEMNAVARQIWLNWQDEKKQGVVAK